MDLLKAKLETHLASVPETSNEGALESELFEKFYYCGKGNCVELRNKTYKDIPKFHNPVVIDEESLPCKLREDARGLFLRRRSSSLLDNEELKSLWALLHGDECPSDADNEIFITYDDFKQIAGSSNDKCRPYFSAEVFAKLHQNDPYNRVGIVALFNYIMRKVWLNQTRIGISIYDVTGKGYLRECDLKNYIQDLIPTLPQLEGLEESFHSFYVCMAVRKFLFFLDPLRTGKVRVQDILACSFLDDLLELRDQDLKKEQQEKNWFSAPTALRVYGQYLNLDKDHNGLLNKEELAGLGTGTLTNAFLNRVFQECLTYDGEMDYKTYLDFILALENKKDPQSIQYFFRVLDINNKGYLDRFSLNYFFRAIQEQMTENGQEPVPFSDVSDEIFDMIKPADPTRITLRDIINSGKGGTLLNLLIDLNEFWSHENRERVAGDEASDS